MDFLKACKDMISIDSTPSNGTHEVAHWCADLARSMGFQVRLQEELNQGVVEANVLCFPSAEATHVHLMLQTHLDTVDPGSFAFWEKNERNPFRAAIHDGNLYGLGAADTKLDFLCKLYAAKDFIGENLDLSFAVVGTYGEEYNMRGAINLVRHKALTADRVLVSEPTNFDLVYAGKGLANLEISLPYSEAELQAKIDHDQSLGQSTQSRIFKGRPTHSSQPQLGINAIEKLFEYMSQLPDQLLLLDLDGGTNYNTVPVQAFLEFDLVSLPEPTLNQKLILLFNKIKELQSQFQASLDRRFDPPMTTLNMGMVRTYSDHIKIMGCVRWPEGLTEKTYTQWMNELRQHCEKLGASFAVRDFKKAYYTDPESEFSRLCHQEVVKQVSHSQLTTQPVTNEANVFNRLGIEALSFGPGLREGNSQTPEESIAIDNLHKAIKIYKDLIKAFCIKSGSS